MDNMENENSEVTSDTLPLLKKQEKKSIVKTANSAGIVLLSTFIIGYLVYWGKSFIFSLFPEGSITFTPIMLYIDEALTYLVAYLLPFLVYKMVHHIPREKAFPFSKISFATGVKSVLFLLGVVAFAELFVTFLMWFTSLFGVYLTYPSLINPAALLELIIYSIYISIFPSFVEEFSFRGVLLSTFRRHGDLLALLCSALLFGLLHMNPVQIPFATILGLGFALIALRTGSLLPAMIVHFINNFRSAVFDYLIGIDKEYLVDRLEGITNVIFIALGILGLVLLLKQDKTFFKFDKGDSTLTLREKLISFFTAPVMILCLIAFIYTALKYVELGVPLMSELL